jgi:hypothetical protein
VGLLVPLAILDRRMQVAGGTGIIPFELAGPKRSAEILGRWGPEGQRAARASLILDFPYLLAYTTLGVRLTGRARDALGSRSKRLGRLGPAVAAIQIAAGVCDAIENAALLGVVARGGDAKLAALARTSARAKFAGLFVASVYGATSLLSR